MRQRRGMIYHVPLKHKDTHNTRLSMFRAYIKTIQCVIEHVPCVHKDDTMNDKCKNTVTKTT